MNESELYSALGKLTKEKERWEENIPNLYSLLDNSSDKIKAKSLWLLGEIGLKYPSSLKDEVHKIFSFTGSNVPLLRERSINALGRIGRGNYKLVEEYWPEMFRFAEDSEPGVRLSFIWASENIATNTPDIYKDHIAVFEKLLHDPDVKVRMEAPEIFRVLGKRRPEFVMSYKEILRNISETDPDRVVKIHCLGAIRAMEMN